MYHFIHSYVEKLRSCPIYGVLGFRRTLPKQKSLVMTRLLKDDPQLTTKQEYRDLLVVSVGDLQRNPTNQDK